MHILVKFLLILAPDQRQQIISSIWMTWPHRIAVSNQLCWATAPRKSKSKILSIILAQLVDSCSVIGLGGLFHRFSQPADPWPHRHTKYELLSITQVRQGNSYNSHHNWLILALLLVWIVYFIDSNDQRASLGRTGIQNPHETLSIAQVRQGKSLNFLCNYCTIGQLLLNYWSWLVV